MELKLASKSNKKCCVTKINLRDFLTENNFPRKNYWHHKDLGLDFSYRLIHFPITLSTQTPPSSKRRVLSRNAGRVFWVTGRDLRVAFFARALLTGNHIIQKSGSVLLAEAIFHSCGCLWHLADTPRPREIHSAKEQWKILICRSWPHAHRMFSFHSDCKCKREPPFCASSG